MSAPEGGEAPDQVLDAVGQGSPPAAGEPAAGEGEAAERTLLARAEEAERRAEEAFHQLQRMRADFENFRRRLMLEQVRWQDQAVGSLVRELLPVLDNLERALAACRADEAGPAGGPVAALRQGVELVVRQFREVLGRVGVAAIEAVGEPFDPERHEAVARTEEVGVERETVAEEFRKGYLFKGQLLRASLVRVAVPASPYCGEPVSESGSRETAEPVAQPAEGRQERERRATEGE